MTQLTSAAHTRATALKKAAAAKQERAVSNADKAIRHLSVNGQDVTFRAVARAGNVSVNFLYNNPELRHRIERLRANTPGVGRTQPNRQADIDSSSNPVLRALTAQLAAEKKDRHAEVTLLRAQLAAAHGELLNLRRTAAAAGALMSADLGASHRPPALNVAQQPETP